MVVHAVTKVRDFANIICQIMKKILLVCLLLIPVSCDRSEDDTSQLYRFLDHLEKQHVIKSPIENLRDNFESKEEDLTGKWHPVLPSSPDSKTWAASTQFKLLGFDESQKPEGMSVYQDGGEIKFSPFADGQNLIWKWVKGTKTFSAVELKNYNRKFKHSIVSSKKPVEFLRVFPEGAVEFEIYVKKGGKKSPPSQLQIYLNDNLINTIEVNSLDYEIARFYADVKLNKYQVKIVTTNSDLHIKRVKVLAEHDLILLSVPVDQAEVFQTAAFKTEYPSQKLKNEKQGLYSSEYLVSLLAGVSAPGIPDLGVSSALPEIKKKLVIDDLALNSILAPPDSEFRFKVNIPLNGILEFGYGIMDETWFEGSGEVNFLVELNESGSSHTLFSGALNPALNESPRNLTQEKIDLNDFSGKEVEITFKTAIADNQNSADLKIGNLAFWFNPLLYPNKLAAEPTDEDGINVVLISIDTLRFDHLGTYGYSRDTSPYVDQLAIDSVQFNNCFVQSNWTLPSHTSMLTALNCFRHQVYLADEKMSPSLITVADILRMHDYYCGGITGGGYVSEKFGFSKGFDDYKGERFVFHAEDEAEQLRDATITWLEKNEDKKFFLFLHTYQVHDPYYSHAGYTEQFVEGELSWKTMPIASYLRDKPEKRRYKFTEKQAADIVALYDGEIKYMDENLIRPVMQKLKDLGLYDRTLIIFTSDHGEEFLDHNSWLHKHTLFNELIKVPLLIKYPDSEFQGKHIDTVVRSIDIVPTILEAVGIDPVPFDMDGVSMQQIVLGKEQKNRVFFSDFSQKGSSGLRPAMVATNQDYFKLIVNRKTSPPKTSIFNWQEDILEKKNLEKSQSELLRAMFQRILDYYDNFKAVAATSDKVVMDKALEERLKALGYIH